MSRLASAAATNSVINRILQTQRNLFDQQLRVTSEQQSQTYRGLDGQSERLISLENTRASLLSFQGNNDIANLRLSIQETAVDGIRTSIRDFRQLMINFQQNGVFNEESVNQIQDDAFRALLDMESLLNTEADDGFVFAGTRKQTEPVSLGLSTKAAFQSEFDGARVTVPTTRAAQLASFSVSDDGTNENPAFLTFEQLDGTSGLSRINSSTAQFQNLQVGTKITISDTVGGQNDGTFTIAAVDSNGLFIDVVTEQLTTEGSAAVPVSSTFTFPDSIDSTQTQVVTTNAYFNRQSSTITASTANAFSDIQVGEYLTVSGTTNNNRTFTVASNDGTNIVIEEKRLVDSGGADTNVITDAGGNVTFTDSGGTTADTITAPAGTFSTTQVGQQLRISGTGTANDNLIVTVASVSADGSTATLSSGDALTSATPANSVIDVASAGFFFDVADVTGGEIVFTDNSPTADTITLTNGTFTDRAGNALPVGTQITFANTASNNGTFTIASLNSTNTVATLVATDTLTDETENTNATATVATTFGTIAATSYYNGDTVSQTHRVSETREFEFDINAVDPAFEKAIRAMQLIAQGAYNSEGGLDQNQERVSQAIFLLDSSIDRTVAGSPPFGAEEVSSVEQISINIGYRQVLIQDVENRTTNLVGFLEASIADIENVDNAEAITRLLDEQRVLEASFQTFARVRQLSLTQFL